MRSTRVNKFNELIAREVAEIIRDKLIDPRLGLVTVHEASLSPDLKSGKIYVSILEQDKVADTIKVLNQAAGFIQNALAKKLSGLRVIPKLKFFHDASLEEGAKIEKMLHLCQHNEKTQDP